METVLMVACASVVTGFIVGIWLMAMVATAALSRSQDRMQRKIRYWQDQCMRHCCPSNDARPEDGFKEKLR